MLEIGAGVGTLTEHLAPLVARVLAVEIDRKLEPALAEVLGEHANVELGLGRRDAASISARSSPPPTAFVANLPYNVAAPLILRSIDALPSLRTWCCLIQREVADRFLATAGEDAYGAPSVLCGLALEPAGRHAVSRSVFVPVPNVDSSLVAFRRPGGLGRAGRALAARSWRSSRPASRIAARRSRTRCRWRAGPRAPRSSGSARRSGSTRGSAPRRCRPRRSSRSRRRMRARPREGCSRRRKINLVLRVGPRRADGYHELASLIVALDVGDTIELERGRGARPSRLPRSTAGTRSSAARSGCSPSAAGTTAASPCRLDKRLPVGAGLGGGSADAGVALRIANRLLSEPLEPAALIALAAEVGSDVPFFAAGLAAGEMRGRGERVRASAAARAAGDRGRMAGRAGVDRRGLRGLHEPAWSETGSHVRADSIALAARADLRTLTALVANDLSDVAERLCPASAALRRELRTRGALARGRGSGSAVFGIFETREGAETALGGLPGAAWSAVSRCSIRLGWTGHDRVRGEAEGRLRHPRRGVAGDPAAAQPGLAGWLRRNRFKLALALIIGEGSSSRGSYDVSAFRCCSSRSSSSASS